jgi:hypothetical protein
MHDKKQIVSMQQILHGSTVALKVATGNKSLQHILTASILFTFRNTMKYLWAKPGHKTVFAFPIQNTTIFADFGDTIFLIFGHLKCELVISILGHIINIFNL